MDVKRESNLRQAGVLGCLAAAAILLGLLVGGTAGEALLAVGGLVGVFTLLALGSEFSRTR